MRIFTKGTGKRRTARTAGLTALICGTLLCSSFFPAAAAETGINGDLTQDGALSSADAEMLAAHLTGEQPLTDSTAAHCADLNADGILNASDLTLLKRLILTQTAPEPPSETKEIPLSVLTPTLPSTGNVRVLLILVSFPDCAHPDSLSAADVQTQCFGPEEPDSRMYPMESISAYYARASYGRLHLTGDVCTYTAKDNLKRYVNKRDILAHEVFAGLDPEIDFSRYDADRDGITDAVILALPGSAGKTDWRALTGKYTEKDSFDGCRIGARTVGASDVTNQAMFNSVWTHELGHAMGLPDYYKYFNTEKGYYGMYGDAGWELMDDAFGDLSAFSKLMLGWYEESEVQVYTGGTQTFRIPSSQAAPGCVVIPRGTQTDWLSEFFVLEYQTNTGNNCRQFENNHTYPLFSEGGLRALHAEATVCEGVQGMPELKWNNYGRYYDSSNEKQRVLRLANAEEGGGFFRSGDVLNDSISGFHWYDGDGSQTVPVGCSVTVQSIADGICTLQITE